MNVEFYNYQVDSEHLKVGTELHEVNRISHVFILVLVGCYDLLQLLPIVRSLHYLPDVAIEVSMLGVIEAG